MRARAAGDSVYCCLQLFGGFSSCSYVYVLMCVHTFGGLRTTLGVIIRKLSTFVSYFFETGSLINLELAK